MKYKVAPWVELLVTDLWSNKKTILEVGEFNITTYFDDDIEGEDPIDPKLREGIDSLSDETLESISYVLEDVPRLLGNCRTKTAFSQALVPLLSNGAVFVSA
jgi:hypothetical protein